MSLGKTKTHGAATPQRAGSRPGTPTVCVIGSRENPIRPEAVFPAPKPSSLSVFPSNASAAKWWRYTLGLPKPSDLPATWQARANAERGDAQAGAGLGASEIAVLIFAPAVEKKGEVGVGEGLGAKEPLGVGWGSPCSQNNYTVGVLAGPLAFSGGAGAAAHASSSSTDTGQRLDRSDSFLTDNPRKKVIVSGALKLGMIQGRPSFRASPKDCYDVGVAQPWEEQSLLDRMVTAVERVRERLQRAAAALEAAGVPYAVVGGNAVAAWVATVDPAAVRSTQDVDILFRRSDLDAAERALAAAGFVRRHAAGIEMFLDGPDARFRDALRVVIAGEKIRPVYTSPAPDVTEAIKQEQVGSSR